MAIAHQKQENQETQNQKPREQRESPQPGLESPERDEQETRQFTMSMGYQQTR